MKISKKRIEELSQLRDLNTMKPLIITETKENVLALNTENLENIVDELVHKYPIRALKGKLSLVFSGFDDVNKELFDIPEFKLFARKLFDKVPIIVYMLSREIACVILTSIFEVEDRYTNGPFKRVQVSISIEDHFKYQEALENTKLTRMEIQETLVEYFSRGILEKPL